MKSNETSRRRFLQLSGTAAVGALLPLPVLAEASPEKPARFIVNSAGGVMGENVVKAYGSVFKANTDIDMEITSPPDLGKLKAMVESGNIEWDVTELNSSDAMLAAEQGLLETIDDSIVDRSSYPESARDPHVLTFSIYSTNLAWRDDAFEGEKPSTWADFWDVERFPGARALQNNPVDNLEFALIADGVAIEDLYPLDVERAFAKLDQIKEHIVAFWESGAQQVQMLVDSEVVMSSAWNGRMMTAANAGTPVKISWNGAIVKQAYFGIPKGVKNAHWSQHFLAAVTDARAQATFANTFAAPGPNPASLEFIEEAVRPYNPIETEHQAVAVWQDAKWWNENVTELKQRWQRWMLS